jgi:molybdopterin-guanine dinucleotide biosynthesis protein A
MPADDPPAYPRDQITAVILAGGRGARMGGVDKGLLTYQYKPLIAHVLAAVSEQVDQVLINANRSADKYTAFGLPVIADTVGDFAGPLAGMLAGMRAATTPYVLFVPCDTPHLPDDLVARLWQAMQTAHARISVAHDGTRLHPVVALMRRDFKEELEDALHDGMRRTGEWIGAHHPATADYSDLPAAFVNINDPETLAELQSKHD